MRVLVTNDDGIFSPGLHALAAAVAGAGHEPVVAAPSTDWSGASACLGPLDDPDRVSVERVEIPGMAGPDGGALIGYSVGALRRACRRSCDEDDEVRDVIVHVRAISRECGV